MSNDPDTTPELTEVITRRPATARALDAEDQFADRLDDGKQGLASAELGDAGPYEDEQVESLPADIRPDQLEREELDTDDDSDPTARDGDVDLQHLEGNIRGPGEADLHALRNSGERAAAVADEKQYRPDGPVTAAPTRKR